MAAAGTISAGMRRYALAVQYHGAPFLGFSYQHEQEDCITKDGTDLRGLHSVEGRLRRALASVSGSFENLQVSSRTDRGVHALKNTLHVDLTVYNKSQEYWQLQRLVKAINYQLCRQPVSFDETYNESKRNTGTVSYKRKRVNTLPSFGGYVPGMNHVRVTNAKIAPPFMDNQFAVDNPSLNQPTKIPWNARFSATQRTYIYRIIQSSLGDNGPDIQQSYSPGLPFEYDRAWIVNDNLDIQSMVAAAKHLTGTHDFTSFRAARCQRDSPIMTMEDINISCQPYWSIGSNIEGTVDACQLITLRFVGNAFLYRQVRNLVGCLVHIGTGKIKSNEVIDLLDARNRRLSPMTAPAQGLFLTNVLHGNFDL